LGVLEQFAEENILHEGKWQMAGENVQSGAL
jgi:hypothetical protein